MKLHGALVFAGCLATTFVAYGDIVIDDFSCVDSLTQTGLGVTNSVISCPGSIGGIREDSISIIGGSGSSVSTLNSNPPAGEITGVFGSGLIGNEGMAWTGSTTSGIWDLNLSFDVSTQFLDVAIESNQGGTLTIDLGSGPVASNNFLSYTAAFPNAEDDVRIPLFVHPTVIGTGADLEHITYIGLGIAVPDGGTWTITGIVALPEPSVLLLTSIFFLGILTRSFWRRSSRQAK